jgi:type IV pilus assembly protein PilN
MIKINLLPVRASKKREVGRQWLVFFALVVTASAIGNWFWLSSIEDKLGQAKKLIAKYEGENAELKKIIGEVKDIKKEKDEMKQKLGVLNKLKDGRMGPVRVMDELATIIPARVWINTWEETGGAVTMMGSGVNNEEVASFMRKMKESKYFDNVNLKSLRLVRDNEVSFTITCSVKFAA